MSVATPEIVLTYKPRGAASDIFSLRNPELVLSGPAGTGKSRSVIEKLHLAALKYPNARILMVRKTRRSLSESAMVTYWQKIRPDMDRVQWKSSVQQYQYPNGAIIAVGGMDKPSKIMSSEWDMIYVQECTEFTENDWEACTIRLRNGVMPYQQLIGDCNPDAPTHWLKQRAIAGKTLMLESRHEDNPLLFSEDREITIEGRRYLGSLESLSGVRLARYRYGIWAAAEGTVYEDVWDRSRNIVDPFPIPKEWPRYLSIDFGYNHPFCFDKETDILTRTGWKKFSDLEKGELVATINPDLHSLEWQTPTDYISYHYKGDMITASNPLRGGARFSVTPNHDMVLIDTKGVWRKRKADDMPKEWRIPTSWNSIRDEENVPMFEIPRCIQAFPNRKRLSPVPRESFARFLGLFITEGYVDRGVMVEVVQKKYIAEAREIFDSLGWGYSESPGNRGCIRFRISSKELAQFLNESCGEQKSKNKVLPDFVFDWDAGSLRALLDGLILGDGTKGTLDGGGNVDIRQRFYSTSLKLVEQTQTIACLLGIPTRLRSQKSIGGYGITNEITIYYLTFPKERNPASGRINAKRTLYDDMVYCVTVPNGTLVVRREGKPMISGNCCLWAAKDPDGRYYIYRQIYMTKRLVEDHAKEIKRVSRWGEKNGDPLPREVICDHDAEDRATLERHLGLYTIAAKKTVSDGIQAMAARLRPAGDGKPRLMIFRDCLVERDRELVNRKLPTCFEDEPESYVWDTRQGMKRGEQPVKESDHACDAARYLCAKDLIPSSVTHFPDIWD